MTAHDSSSLVLPTEISEAIEEMQIIARVAGQCSVEGPEDARALMAAAEADRAARWADLLLRVETARQELARQVQELQKGSRVDSHSSSENTSTASDIEATPATSTVEARVRYGLRCKECGGPLVWDARWQGTSCHFCHKLFEDRCADLGAMDTDDVKHALEDQRRLKDVAADLHVAEQEVLKWKEQLDIRGRLWMEVAEANAKALHVAEQERDALKKEVAALQDSAMIASFVEALDRHRAATLDSDRLRSALTQQIAEWRESAANRHNDEFYREGLTHAANKIEALLTEGRSQDGQP